MVHTINTIFMRWQQFFTIIPLALVLGCVGNSSDELREGKEKIMVTNFKNYTDHVWNRKNMDSLLPVSDANYVRELNGIKVANNLNELEANLHIYFVGFPDLKVTIVDSGIKDTILFCKWTLEGTNTGVFGETAPTGKRVKIAGLSNFSFNNEGKIRYEDVYYNELQLLQQLGYTLQKPVLE